MKAENWGRGILIGLTIIGTTIGAGFASGREIWEFFSSYGWASHYSILLSMALFGLCSIIILWISWVKQTKNYLHLLQSFMGDRLAKVFDLFMILYLTSLTVVMLAGSGATFAQWGIPFIFGVIICALLVFAVILRETKGILLLNMWLMPILIVALITLSVYYTKYSAEGSHVAYGEFAWHSAIIYASLNIIPLVAVLSTFGEKIKHKGEIYLAGIVTFLGLAMVALSLNAALLKASGWIGLYEIPLFALLQGWPQAIKFGITILLWLAIYTTAVSGIYGIVYRLQKSIPFPIWQTTLFLLVFLSPFSGLGFSLLVSYLYPFFGVLNLFLFALLLLYPLRDIR